MTSFAATPHWDQEDGDKYYVDENSVKVTNAWVSMPNDDLLDDDEYNDEEWGRMLDLWGYPSGSGSDSKYTNEKGSSSSATAAYYREDEGGRDKNWIWSYPNTNYDDYGDDPYWCYLDSNGRPFRAEADSKLTDVGAAVRIDDDDVTDTADPEYNGKVGAKSIKSETYLFNNRGVMLSGLYWLGDTDEGGISEPVYKGTSVESTDGERTKVLINENGKIKKSGKVTDMDDQKVTVSNYVVQTIEADD